MGNIYIIFDTNLYRKIIGIPMGANRVPIEAELILFCRESDFMGFFFVGKRKRMPFEYNILNTVILIIYPKLKKIPTLTVC